MGLRTWVAGMRPTAAQIQELDNETINRCTSSTRPADALTVEGMRIWQIDNNRMMVRVPTSGVAGTGDGTGGKWVCEPGQTVICTAATRPIAAECTVGLQIFETDTGKSLSWTGALFGIRTPVTAATAAGLLADPTAGQLEYQVDTSKLWVKKDSGREEIMTTTTGWFLFAFQGVWANYGNSFQAAQYRQAGRSVDFRGLVTPSANVASGSVIGVLPVGFRPLARLIMTAQSAGLERVDVDSGGQVIYSGASLTAGSFLSLQFSFGTN